jgi:hypothetical protein
MCEPGHHQHHQDCTCGGDCKCGESGCHCDESCGCENIHFQRRYQTKAEQIADLENYMSDLKQEVQAVEERLTDLRK